MLRRAPAVVLDTALGVGGGLGLAALERSGVISPWAAFLVLLAGSVAAFGYAFHVFRDLMAHDLWVWEDLDDDR